jgi:ribonuclease PH
VMKQQRKAPTRKRRTLKIEFFISNAIKPVIDYSILGRIILPGQADVLDDGYTAPGLTETDAF